MVIYEFKKDKSEVPKDCTVHEFTSLKNNMCKLWVNSCGRNYVYSFFHAFYINFAFFGHIFICNSSHHLLSNSLRHIILRW